PKNILKTLLSKIPDISPPRKEIISKKEAASAANIQPLFIEDDEDNIYGDSLMINEGNTIFNKWKIIIPVIILAIVMGIILFRSDSKIESEIINKNAETAQNSIELNPSLNATNISSSTKESGD
ncbi:MAG: hypothetical protein HW401_657, partial [Parcubacteria group bacterium]|nr:hypothetical protein [Parcubacteria group bacterium]